MNRYDIIDEFNVDFDYSYLNDVINHTFEKLCLLRYYLY